MFGGEQQLDMKGGDDGGKKRRKETNEKRRSERRKRKGEVKTEGNALSGIPCLNDGDTISIGPQRAYLTKNTLRRTSKATTTTTATTTMMMRTENGPRRASTKPRNATSWESLSSYGSLRLINELCQSLAYSPSVVHSYPYAAV